MNPVKTSLLQRGALLIVAVVLILVIAVLVLSLSFMAVSNLGASGGHLSSAQALYIAESGIESALQRLHRPGLGCISGASSVGETGMLVGQGKYTTIATTFATSSHTVTSAMNVVGTIVPVTAPITDFAPHGRVLIQFEEIDYSGTSTSATVCGTAPCLTGARRGAAGTTAAAHAVGVGVNQNLCLIRSTGTANTAVRVAERTIHSPDAMIVYSSALAAAAGSTDTPGYRIWNQLTPSWGGEFRATPVTAGTQIRHMVIKFARTRSEAILGTLSSNGQIHVQVWNGFVWGPIQLLANVGGGNSAFRGFDIAYETGSDRAIVVYNNANNRNPAYRIWSGGPAWSAAVALNVATELGVNYPTTGAPIWIDLARNPLRANNEIVMITQDNNLEVTGVRWNGTRWVAMGALGVWATTDSNDQMAIGVAYEQRSGRAMFVWGDDGAPPNNAFRTWDGATATLSAINTTALNIPAQGGTSEWVRLVAQPNSNNLMFGVQDSSRDLNTRFWNGAAWDTAVPHPEHDNATEDDQNRNFDLVFETHPLNRGIAWIVWGGASGGADNVRRRRWSGTAWGVPTTVGDDTNLVQLLAQPGTGTVFAAHYEDTAAATPEELLAARLINGDPAWPVVAATQIIWPGRTNEDPVHTRVFFGARGHVSIGRRETYP